MIEIELCTALTLDLMTWSRDVIGVAMGTKADESLEISNLVLR